MHSHRERGAHSQNNSQYRMDFAQRRRATKALETWLVYRLGSIDQETRYNRYIKKIHKEINKHY